MTCEVHEPEELEPGITRVGFIRVDGEFRPTGTCRHCRRHIWVPGPKELGVWEVRRGPYA